MKQKVALIIHGWPQFEIKDHFLCKHLRKSGYRVIAPNLFTERRGFTLKNIKKLILKKTDGTIIDLMVGISLGGLITPKIAVNYPKAKLVFISSAVKLNGSSLIFTVTLKIFRSILNSQFASLIDTNEIPEWLVRLVYQKFNPFHGNSDSKKDYISDMDRNILFIKRISVKKEGEIIDFATKIDNTKLLKKLKNKSLVINGKNDVLMNQSEGKRLAELLQNATFIETEGSHFNSFTEGELEVLNSFLKN